MIAQFLLRWSLRVSLLWLPIGLFITFKTPEWIDYLPSNIHTLLPIITGTLILLNLIGSVLILARTGQALNALAATLVQLPLFAMLFFQIAHHLGPSHFYFERAPQLQDWLLFTGAHALRAADLFDFLEAYDIRFQNIRHASELTSFCLVMFHFVIDLFLLRVLLTWVMRDSQRANQLSHGIPGWVAKLGGAGMWCVLYGSLFTAWLAWWWFGNQFLRDYVISNMSLMGLIYLIGTIGISFLGWELYARGNNKWTYGRWIREWGWGRIGALVLLQLFLGFAFPFIDPDYIGFSFYTALVFWFAGRVLVMSRRITAQCFHWNQNSYDSQTAMWRFRMLGLFGLPLLLLLNFGVFIIAAYTDRTLTEFPTYFPGLVFRTLVLIAMLPLVENILVAVFGWTMRRLDRGVRNPAAYGYGQSSEQVSFRLQPWAIPAGWLMLFALLTPIWWWAATSYTHWRAEDMFWWPIDNFLRVFDFVDVMQIYHLQLAVTPRDLWLGTLTFICRLLMGLSLVGLFGSLLRLLSLRFLGGFGMTEVDLRYYMQSRGHAQTRDMERANRRLQTLHAHPVSDQQVMHTLGVGLLVLAVSFGIVVICQEKGWPDWTTQAQRLGETIRIAPSERQQLALEEIRRLGPYSEVVVPLLTDRALNGELIYITALGDIGSREALAVLCKCSCDDRRAPVALAAVDALANGGRKSVPALLTTYLDAPLTEARQAARQAIVEIGRDAVPIIVAWNRLQSRDELRTLADDLDPYWRESAWVLHAAETLERTEFSRPNLNFSPVIVTPSGSPAPNPGSPAETPMESPAATDDIPNPMGDNPPAPAERVKQLVREIDETCSRAEDRLRVNQQQDRLKRLRDYLNAMKDPGIDWPQVAPDRLQAHIDGLIVWRSWLAVNARLQELLDEYDRKSSGNSGLAKLLPGPAPDAVTNARRIVWDCTLTEAELEAAREKLATVTGRSNR